MNKRASDKICTFCQYPSSLLYSTIFIAPLTPALVICPSSQPAKPKPANPETIKIAAIIFARLFTLVRKH